MIIPEAVVQWKRSAHGPRVQVKAICYIARKIAVYEEYADMIGIGMPTLKDIFNDCHTSCTPDVSIATLRRW